VKSLAANINHLQWRSNLPEDQRPNLTLIYRDNQHLTVAFGNEYTDERAPASSKASYRVEQQSRDGLVYSSKIVVPEPQLQSGVYLSEGEAKQMLRAYNYFDRGFNPDGAGGQHQYEKLNRNGANLVFDRVNGLTWQQSGSEGYVRYEQVQAYVVKLNKEKFGGYSDWRLPTLNEGMSLMEREKINDLFLNKVFDRKQTWIWTMSKVGLRGMTWYVSFLDGVCYGDMLFGSRGHIRAVRSGK